MVCRCVCDSHSLFVCVCESERETEGNKKRKWAKFKYGNIGISQLQSFVSASFNVSVEYYLAIHIKVRLHQWINESENQP